MLALFSLAVLALLGWKVESQAGWLTCPPRWDGAPVMLIRRGRRRTRPLCRRRYALWGYVRRSWRQPVLRSLALGALWWLGGRPVPVLIMSWPWVLWL